MSLILHLAVFWPSLMLLGLQRHHPHLSLFLHIAFILPVLCVYPYMQISFFYKDTVILD